MFYLGQQENTEFYINQFHALLFTRSVSEAAVAVNPKCIVCYRRQEYWIQTPLKIRQVSRHITH